MVGKWCRSLYIVLCVCEFTGCIRVEYLPCVSSNDGPDSQNSFPLCSGKAARKETKPKFKFTPDTSADLQLCAECLEKALE